MWSRWGCGDQTLQKFKGPRLKQRRELAWLESFAMFPRAWKGCHGWGWGWGFELGGSECDWSKMEAPWQMERFSPPECDRMAWSSLCGPKAVPSP